MVVLLPVLACTTKAYFLAAQFHSSVAYVGCSWSPIGAGPRGGFIHHWLIAGRNCYKSCCAAAALVRQVCALSHCGYCIVIYLYTHRTVHLKSRRILLFPGLYKASPE